MKIAVNTRLLLKNKLEGIGVFTFETLSRIAKNHPEHEFIFLFDRPFDDEFIFSSNITPVVISPQARHPLLYLAWFEFAVPAALNKYGADVFLSPDGFLSLNTEVKSIPVIHDLNFEHYPEYLPYADRVYYRYFFPRFARKARRIATVSEYSKFDIVNSYRINADKIDVVHNAAGVDFKPIPNAEKSVIKTQYSEGKNYFLFVGALHPRKNISNLLKAFDQFKTQSGTDIKLILAGNKKWWDSEMIRTYEAMKHKQDVVFTGRLTRDEVCKLTAAAFVMLYVPLFEGFGIPAVEAMNCDVPVIASNSTSLPEVCGDAALYTDPKSVNAITQAMISMYSDELLRNNLIEKGKIQRNKFSWDQSAQQLWDCVEQAIK